MRWLRKSRILIEWGLSYFRMVMSAGTKFDLVVSVPSLQGLLNLTCDVPWLSEEEDCGTFECEAPFMRVLNTFPRKHFLFRLKLTNS